MRGTPLLVNIEMHLQKIVKALLARSKDCRGPWIISSQELRHFSNRSGCPGPSSLAVNRAPRHPASRRGGLRSAKDRRR